MRQPKTKKNPQIRLIILLLIVFLFCAGAASIIFFLNRETETPRIRTAGPFSAHTYEYSTRETAVSLVSKSGKPDIQLSHAGQILAFTPDEKDIRIEKKEGTIQYTPKNNDYTYLYSPIDGGIKEDIVLSRHLPAKDTFDFTFSYQGLRPQLNQAGGVDFVNKNNDLVFTALPPYMEDAKGVRSTQVWYKVRETGISVVVDSLWLADKSRSYPVRIDPTIVRGANPVGAWTFDEAYGSVNTANSITGGASAVFAGTTKPAWQSDAFCVSRSCLYFEGQTANATVSDTPSVKSVSFWVRPLSLSNTFLQLSTSAYISSNASGVVSANGFTSPSIYVNGILNAPIVANRWQHIMVTSSTAVSATALKFGVGNNSATYYKGFMDTVTLFDYVRSGAEILADMNAVGALSMKGSSAVFAPSSRSFLSDGLIGYWKLDEATGDAVDSSGNGYTLTNNGTTTYVGGKYGSGSEHVPASNQYLSLTGGQTNVYYFNASDGGPTDEDTCFTNDADAFDSNTGTYAYATTNYGCTLHGWGTNAPTSGSTITQVRARIYGCYTNSGVNAAILYSSEDLGGPNIDAELCPTAGWSEYVTLSVPSGGWTWQKVNDLKIYFNSDSVASGSRFYDAQVEVTSGGSLTPVNSIAFWTNPDSTTNYYLSLTSGAYLTSTTGTLSATGLTNAKIYVNGTESTTITADAWQHVVVTFDAVTPDQLYIGRQGSNYFDGTMDEVRLYSKTLSPSDILSLYRWSPGPVGYLRLDEGTGSNAYDSSGSGNNCNLTSTFTPGYVSGKFGGGYDIYGNGNPTYETDVIDCGTTPYANIWDSGGTLSAWFYLRNSGDGDVDGMVFYKGNFWVWVNSNGALYFRQYFSGDYGNWATQNSAITFNAWNHIAIVYDSDAITNDPELYINGQKMTLSTDTNPIGTRSSDSSSTFYIGTNGYTGNAPINGIVDEVRIYNYARTPGQIIEDMNGGHPVGGSPIGSQMGYWKFDQDYGSTAYDSSSFGLDAALTANASLSPSGKYGKAIYFNGTGSNTTASHAYIPNDALDTLTEGSVSFWIRPSDSGDDFQNLFSVTDGSAGFSNTYEIGYRRSTNTVEVWSYFNFAERINASFPVPGSQTEWHHLVWTVGPTGNSMYIDGIKATGAYTTGSTTTNYFYDDASTGTTRYSIGCVYDDNGCYDNELYEGYLDELKVYSSELTAAQVLTEYNHGSMVAMGSTGLTATRTPDNSLDRSFCPPGDTTASCAPLVWWKMDEGTGLTANNSISSSFNGTLTNGPAWSTGKMNKGISFDGGNDYVIGNNVINSTSAYSVSMWVNLRSTSTDDTFFSSSTSDTSSLAWYILDGTLNNMRYCNDGICSNTATSLDNVIQDNTWQHIALVYDGAGTIRFYVNGMNVTGTDGATSETSDTGNVIIGNFDTNNNYGLDGVVDDVRIYSYARTQAQVAWEYNRGRPMLHYKLNECTGTTLHNYAQNASGQSEGLHANLVLGATGQTAAGDCSTNASTAWYTGRDGKYGASVNFDGQSDYATITDLTSQRSSLDFVSGDQITISAWIYPTTMPASNAYATFFSKAGSGGNGYYAQIKGNGALEYCNWDPVLPGGGCFTTDDLPVQTEVWQHVLFTMTLGTGSTARWYYNGTVYAGTWNDSGDVVAPLDNGDATIGSSGGAVEMFTGKIDDVQIFHYTPTQEQIRQIMSENSAVRFGAQ